MVPFRSGLDTPPVLVSSAGLCKDMVEVAIEDTEKEEREEDHDKKVADENVVPAISQILSQVCGTKNHLAISQITHFTITDLGIVEVVASIQLQEPGDVPEDCEQDCRKNIETGGVSEQSEMWILILLVWAIWAWGEKTVAMGCCHPQLLTNAVVAFILHMVA